MGVARFGGGEALAAFCRVRVTRTTLIARRVGKGIDAERAVGGIGLVTGMG